MLEFVQLLKQRYQSVLSQLTNESNKSQYHKRIDNLILAEAFLRKGQMLVNTPDYPLQVAVVGPTQAGKSSVVNVLLNSSAAGVSPLAGYTIHPQGFCDGVTLSACSGLQWYFGRFQQVQQSQLSKDRHDCYSLTQNTTNSTFLPDSVLWDTPDFDSIDSVNYREGVIRTVALADMVVLVVSKEKYADQSVWDIMADIEALQQPTIICLNKLSEGSETLLINSLKDKWQQIRKDDFPQVVPLYYQKQTGMPQWPDAQQLQRLARQVSRKKQSRLEQELLQKHWQSWLEPVLAEHSSLKDWQGLVDQVIQQGLDSYQRDYLNHPHHYETFQHALAELLNLLEIPGLAGILANTRRLLTWPIRKMMSIGRKRLHITESSQEITLLKQIAEHVLIQLADKLMNQAEQNRQCQWWKEFSSLLRTQRANILQDFADAAQQYHLAFQDEVENTANRLFHKLEEQPTLLNSLRATRVTADAAVIALALHTGGIGMHDLIIAPAMLTVTSLLAESALGSYMGRVEAELKQRQLAAVKQALFTDSMKLKLLELSGQLSSVTYFNISPEQLQQAESQLIEKRHAYDYFELVEKTKRWAEQALSAGWISTETAQALCAFDARTPEALFNHNGSRPLIVAFMGGTGVGKSSLLNRLAGKAIAKAGIERPTSREVTLFHHRDVAIQHLPEKLPIEKIIIAQHDDETKKNIVWIDMPDFDSTEQSNKAQVFEWLPHIDVLIYVVSPERYRDEKAWRLLMSEGNRHAWLFVLNQWDRGQQAQYEDFKQQLGKAGFVEPIIFKTVCGESSYPDEFAALQSTILSLSNKHVVAELEQRGTQIRKDELRQKLQVIQQILGSHSAFKKAEEMWQIQWRSTANQLQQGFSWPIQRLAAYYADHAADLIGNSADGANRSNPSANALWDDWAQARFGDALDEFIVKVDELGLPVTPLKNQLAAVRTKAPKIVQAQSELHVRQALANPGNVLHRSFLKFIRLCEIVLPLAAISWVGYQVFVGYYDSNATHDRYLGVDFAVHSSLLILISWLIPWFILKKLKPSLEKSALRGLTKGLDVAVNIIDSEVLQIIEDITGQHTAQLKQIAKITEECSSGDGYKPAKTGSDNPLTRMLIS